ncbi:MAG: NYN domain-containing protein [Candidatus Eisenbacteria bacterium]
MSDRLIIVDGYNLILRTPTLKPGSTRTLAESRAKLEALLTWVMGPAAQFLVIYDGAQGMSGGDTGGRVETRFSKPPQSADDVIREVVEQRIDRGQELTVVTSDAAVARHARAMGADIALADLFLASALGPAATAAETPEKPASLSKKELEEWADIFKRGKPGAGEEQAH